MSFRDVLAYRIACAIWGNSTPIALSPDEAREGYRIADAVLDLIPMGTRNDVIKALVGSQFTSQTPYGLLVRIGDLPALAADVLAAATPTGGGVGASPAATAEPRTPSAQADQDERPPTPPPPLPRMFELYRHRDISGVSGTGTVAWGVQWPDGTASLRWTGAYPAFANWPDIESMLAVHGHEGATQLIWLDGES